jgi:hypothetical protein
MFEMVLSRRFLRVHATSGCPPKLTKKQRRRRATLIHLHPRAVSQTTDGTSGSELLLCKRRSANANRAQS